MSVKHMILTRLFAISSIALLMVGCSKTVDSTKVSRGTGWDLSERTGGFKFDPKYKEQPTGPGLVFIEGGTFTMGRVQDDPLADWNNNPTQLHVQSFYMDETEVTNLMYLEYLDWVKNVFPPTTSGYENIYSGILPDTLVWRNQLGKNDVMTENYLRHPAYANYPVVGVSWVQAVGYSKWRTDMVNAYMLDKEGYTAKNAMYKRKAGETFNTETYLNAPSMAFGGNDSITRGGRESQRLAKASKDSTNLYAQKKDGVILPSYRLPTEAEWEFAALGMSGLREYNQYRGRKKYPWEGSYTRSSARRSGAKQLANFKQGKGDYGGIPGWSDTGADITSEVKSYAPNDYGLYDMAGNVAEWVADVYRPIIDDDFNDFNYYRGNIYTKNKIGPDGKVIVLDINQVVYDTLSNGRIIARNLPGEIEQVALEEKDMYLRTNFSTSDQREFRDGDVMSSKSYLNNAYTQEADRKRMYNSPQHTVRRDSTGIVLEYDKNERSTLINNEVRVYKGGSWRDRSYWLDPAQRRYYPQDMATDYIGFRCAMSRVGSSTKTAKRKRN